MVDRVINSLDEFVRAVHRRYVAVRVLESTAIGLLGGCAIGAILAAMLIWRGEGAWTIVGAALVVGSACGATWGATRRPSSLAAAMEADRQLRTADLLATAWLIRETRNDPFRAVVLAQAAARCQGVAPSAVMLHRMGIRAWGGVALAVAFVWTLAALSSGSLEAARNASQTSGQRTTASNARESRNRPIVEIAMDTPRVQQRAEQNPGDQRNTATDLPTAVQPDVPDRATDPNATDPNEQTSTGTSVGAGNDPGQTRVRDPERRAPNRGPTDQRTSIANPNDAAHSAGGVGPRATNATASSTTSTGVLHDTRQSSAAPPWQREAWPSAVESARRELEQGTVPDDYRDLVRGYFDADTVNFRDSRKE